MLAYDLFRKLTKDDPEIQWDRIVNDVHTKNPWLDLRGVKHHGLRERSKNQSLVLEVLLPLAQVHVYLR